MLKINLKINPSFYHITRCSALVFMLAQWKQSFDIAGNIDFWYCRQSLRAIPENLFEICNKTEDIVCICQSWFKITCSMTSHREYICTITLLIFSLGITLPEIQTLQYLIATASGTKMPKNRIMFLVDCCPKLWPCIGKAETVWSVIVFMPSQIRFSSCEMPSLRFNYL